MLPKLRDSPWVLSAKTTKTFGSSVSHKIVGTTLCLAIEVSPSFEFRPLSCWKAKLVPAGGSTGRTWSFTAL